MTYQSQWGYGWLMSVLSSDSQNWIQPTGHQGKRSSLFTSVPQMGEPMGHQAQKSKLEAQ